LLARSSTPPEKRLIMWRERLGELGGSLRAEWGKAWSVWVPALWLLATVLIAVLTAASLANDFVQSIGNGERPVGSRLPVIDVLGPTLSFAQVVVAVCAIHLVTPEYASRSIVSTFLAQPRRWVVIATKTTVAMVACGLLGLILGPLVNREIELIAGGSTTNELSATAAAVATAVVFASASAVGLALAFLMRSAVTALCASFLLLVVTLFAPTAVGRWLPGRAATSWVGDLATGSVHIGPPSVLAAWSTALLYAAAWFVNRRDA
jgi:ABC-2 type transport system permease protein